MFSSSVAVHDHPRVRVRPASPPAEQLAAAPRHVDPRFAAMAVDCDAFVRSIASHAGLGAFLPASSAAAILDARARPNVASRAMRLAPAQLQPL